jgi:U3 small nucleolar RNA-associated protein 19
MSMLKHLSAAFSIASGTPQIYSVHFRKVVGALLVSSRLGGSSGSCKVEADVRETFVESWLSSYDDVRWFFLRDAT